MIYSSAPPGTSVPIEDQSLKGLLQSAFPPTPYYIYGDASPRMGWPAQESHLRPLLHSWATSSASATLLDVSVGRLGLGMNTGCVNLSVNPPRIVSPVPMPLLPGKSRSGWSKHPQNTAVS